MGSDFRLHEIPKSLDGWTYEIINKLIDHKVVENESFDFKANLPDVNTLTDICCSFANSKKLNTM